VKRLKEMSLREKVDYIWTYYKGYFIAPIVAIAMISVLLTADGGNKKETVLNGVLVNQFLKTEVIEEIEREMLLALDGELETQEVYLDAAVSIDLKSQDVDTIDNLGKITTYVFSEDLDFMIVEPDIARHYAGLNGLADLAECMPKELFEKFDEAELFSYGESKAVLGFYIKDAQFVDDYGIELENPIFCVVNNSPRKEKVWTILEKMFAE